MRIILTLPHKEVFAVLKPGGQLLIDDGRLRLRIETVSGRQRDGAASRSAGG